MEGLIPNNKSPRFKTFGSRVKFFFVCLAQIQLIQSLCYLKIGFLARATVGTSLYVSLSQLVSQSVS